MLSGVNKVKDDVLDEVLDEYVAPSLGGVVVGFEHKIYTNPIEFFKRTLITESMAEVLENVASVVSGGRGSKIVLLSAFFGGGKTHTLIALYHAIRNPEALGLAIAESPEVKKRLEEVGKRLKGVDVIVIDGSVSRLSPSPLSPLDAGVYKVNTLWGYIVHALGRYDDLKEHDRKLLAPNVDEVLKPLSGKRVVIIVDEIARYVQSLYSARDDYIKEYARSVVMFFDSLLKAVNVLNNVALVMSLPIRAGVKAEELEVEDVYKTDITFSLLKLIQRVAARYLEPVKPRDIPALLRVRLFDEVDLVKAKEVSDILKIEYDRNRNIFGEVKADLILSTRNTYPFHPKYIEVLLDVLDKHRGLQKTRDLLRISRKVLRHVISDSENTYDLIMPWHIDVEKDDIRNSLLSYVEYEMFRLPVEEDIVRRCNEYSKPWLAKAVAKALFIRTFVYGGGIVPKPEFFPTAEELNVLVYEPGVFNVRNVQPKDIAEAIDWISINLLYALKDEKTGRLWFTYVSSPIKYVESIAQKVTDAQSYKKILEETKRLLTEPLESVLERRKTRKVEIKVFDIEFSSVSRECKPIDVDTRRYITYTCLDIDVTRKQEILEEIVYRTSTGGMRRYANTIYVIYPEGRDALAPVINYAKRSIACEEVKKENIIEAQLRELKIATSEIEIAKEIYRGKLERHCNDIMTKFYSSLLNAFTRVAYPAMYLDKKVVKEARASPTTSIIYAAEQALKAEKPEKVRYDIDFDTLEYLLKSVKVHLSSAPKKVDDIVDYFYSNPKLPAIPEDAIRNAIAEGVKNLRIGLRCRDRIFFKYIAECEDEKECLEASGAIGESVSGKAVDDACEVLPAIEALKNQMERLEGREVVEGAVKKVEEYYLVYEGKLINVKDVLKHFDRYPVEALLEAPLVKMIRRVIVEIEPKEREYYVEPERKIQHKLIVKRSGPFKGIIRVNVDVGKAEPNEIMVDERFTSGFVTWVIEAPREPGRYSHTLSLVSEDGRTLATSRIDLHVRRLVIELEEEEGIPSEDVPIERMTVAVEGRDLRPIRILRDRLGGVARVDDMEFDLSVALTEQWKSKVYISMSNVGLDDVIAVITNIIQRFSLGEVKASLKLTLVPVEGKGFRMPKLSNDEKDVLSKCKVRYRRARR